MKFTHLGLGFLLLVIPNLAFASPKLDWKTHGLIALTIATSGAVIWVKRNKDLTSIAAKIMGFGVYFWVLIFIQATLYGAYYGLIR